MFKPVRLAEDFNFREELSDWQLKQDGNSLERQFIFQNFNDAFAFMTLVAHYAQELDHHPDWSNSWNRVNVSLTTHSLGGLSNLDVDLAKAMNAFAQELGLVNS